ncbi:MAG TPA: hypothetical protein VJB37_02070 [Patescibacteria group bacterium]|nr:hypothetical protein [Patescibacteria group bacterium]
MWILVLQRMLLELVVDLLYFPFWWYSGGVKMIMITSGHLWQDGNLQLSPGLWLKNIFVPMFGQTDWQGRLMSIFMRLVNVIIRSFGLLIWTAIVALLPLFWLAFPIFLVYMLFSSFV